ncbi:hypothetical protein Bpfe_015571, partial [Biomphalaria pfeifferi]
MLNKVDETVLQVEGQIDQSDKIVSQAKGGLNSLGKEQLAVAAQTVVMEALGIGALSVTVIWASLAGMTFSARNVTAIAATISRRYTELDEKKQMKKLEKSVMCLKLLFL